MKTITHEEYLALCGLYHLAREAEKQVQQYTTAAAKILGEEPNTGTHFEDAVWGYGTDAPDINTVLERMGVTVEANNEPK